MLTNPALIKLQELRYKCIMFVWAPGARVLVRTPEHLHRSTQWHSYRRSNILCYHKAANSKVKLMTPLIGTVKQTNCHSLTDSHAHTGRPQYRNSVSIGSNTTWVGVCPMSLEILHARTRCLPSMDFPVYCFGWQLVWVFSSGSWSQCLPVVQLAPVWLHWVFSGHRTSLKRLKISPKGSPMESRELCIVLKLCRFLRFSYFWSHRSSCTYSKCPSTINGRFFPPLSSMLNKTRQFPTISFEYLLISSLWSDDFINH